MEKIKTMIWPKFLWQVEKYLFRIPVNDLRLSEYFRDMLDSSHVGNEAEGKSDDQPIVLNGITGQEMWHFLEVFFPP